MPASTSSIRLLAIVAVGLTVLLDVSRAAEPPAVSKMTATYKTVGDLKIQADVLRPDDRKMRPVVVWIHGGALITGKRNSVPQPIVDLCRNEGFALVTIDYRLAPETRLPEIISDIDDAFRWLRGDGARQFHLDPDRIVVTGGSAGGYLTLMSGILPHAKLRALVSYWGYGDVDGEWYTKPSDFYRRRPLVKREEAYQMIGNRAVTGSEPNLKNRSRYYLYLRQNGLWTREVTGFDPDAERSRLDPYCPVRNVTPQFPPTLLIHGTKDDDVPYELSAAMDRELTRNKVPHELIAVQGAGHGLVGADKKDINEANEKAAAFIRKYLKGKKGGPSLRGPLVRKLKLKS